MARLGVGYVFFNSRRLKVTNCDFPFFDCQMQASAFTLFKNFNVPLLHYETAAKLAAFGEHVFPVLLFLGLGTRFAAASLIVMTLVIQYVAPGGWPTHLTWALGLIFLLSRGPGPLSLDHFIRKGILRDH